jgi:Kdo2-lipid IVA lauroyltransferase/acyltransferase
METNMPDKRAHSFSPVPALIYYCSLPFIYLVSVLPFPVLYFLSDCLYVILYRVVGYRRKVVMQNLHNSFPGKPEAEIKTICRRFYHNLCDFFLETIKTMTISDKEQVRRCKFTPEADALFARMAAERRSVILVMGHIGNWEWCSTAFNLQSTLQLCVIYHPISNRYFNDLMYRIRTRTGTRLIPMERTYKEMVANKNGINATVFVADQTAQPENAYWTTFLNQDTAVFKGTEVIAKKLNLPVVYASVLKKKRGFYEMNAEMLCDTPTNMREGEVSELFTRRLEQDIIKEPAAWLWSHRRWKHKRPANQKLSAGQ